MKLVECPVVESVPALNLVLYKGTSHNWTVKSDFTWTGLKCITGTSASITSGGDYLRTDDFKSMQQASEVKP